MSKPKTPRPVTTIEKVREDQDLCEHYIPNPKERCMLCHPELKRLQTHSGD